MSMPLVSVIIPVYNGERFLKEAIESVLQQSYHPVETIVVNDGSTDNSAQIAASYKTTRTIDQSNQGQAAALNAGVLNSKGSLIAFLDADDLWPQDKLSLQVEYLREHPEVDFVIGQMFNFLNTGITKFQPKTMDTARKEYVAMALGAILARKEIFQKIGLFDPKYKRAKDVDWFIRAKEAGIQMAIIQKTLLYRRIHETNKSHGIKLRQHEFLRAVKSSIDRKRNRDI